jgi:hypothetical protein|tara:strand:+ start:110 stop:625 length:516 start_codon:yes stop_codon:yes gene_type:complete
MTRCRLAFSLTDESCGIHAERYLTPTNSGFTGYSIFQRSGRIEEREVLVKKLVWLGVSATVLFLFCIGGCQVSYSSHSNEEPEAIVEENVQQPPRWVRIRDTTVAKNSDHKHRANCGHVKLGSWWYGFRGSPKHVHGRAGCKHKKVGGIWSFVGGDVTKGALTNPPSVIYD